MSVTDPGFNPSGDPVITELKERFKALGDYIEEHVTPGRRRSLALTNLETSAMYAVKAQAVGDK